MLRRPWQDFFDEHMRRIVGEKKRILDIGGGLRISKEHSNRVNPTVRWLADEMKERNTEYVVLDYVATFNPDIVGDIQELPLPDASEEAIICIAILEHVENPFKAAAEMYRVLKSGGFCFIYVPFLYYYHAERGYYGDYWRFTQEALRTLFAPFSTIEIQSVRGPLETLVKLSPLGRVRFFGDIAFLLDRAFGKLSSKQTSGYQVFLIK